MPNWLKNFYFYFILFLSSAATAFSRSHEGMIVLFLLTVAILFFNYSPYLSNYFTIVAIWLLYSIVVFFQHDVFTPFFIFRHITYITVAFVMIVIYREDLFFRYERAVFYLSFISLFFFAWQSISGNSLLNIARYLSFSNLEGGSLEYHNFIIYTIERRVYGIASRNYGFAFEPGFYSVFLSIAILFNLMRTNVNLSLRTNPGLYIMATALVTTFSTTGYLALASMVIYLLFKSRIGLSKYFYVLIAISASVYLYFTLDFMQEKITYLYQYGLEIDEVLQRAKTTGTTHSGGRFGGFIIGWEDFKQNPLFGRGGVTALTTGAVGEGFVAIINGLASIMSHYGLFGLIIFFIFLYKSSVNVSHFYNVEAKFAFLVVILIGSVSYSIHDKPLFFTLIFHSLYVQGIFKITSINQSVFFIR